MLFKTALRRDLSNLAGIVFATLFTVMVTTSLIRWLGRAANGLTDTASVLPMIAFGAINLLPVLLVLTVYVSVLMALTRAYRDSEMVIWFSSGRSLLDWIGPVLGFVTPVALLVALVAFIGGPWATLQSNEYQTRFSQREDISRVSAGQFRESASAGRVFYVESLNDESTEVRNVFVSQVDPQREVIVVSQRGQIEVRGLWLLGIGPRRQLANHRRERDPRAPLRRLLCGRERLQPRRTCRCREVVRYADHGEGRIARRDQRLCHEHRVELALPQRE